MPTKFDEKQMSILAMPITERVKALQESKDQFIILHIEGQHLITFTDKSVFSKLYYAFIENVGNKTQILRSLPTLTEIAEQFSEEYLKFVSIFYHIGLSDDNTYTSNIPLQSLLNKMSYTQDEIALNEKHAKSLQDEGFEYPVNVLVKTVTASKKGKINIPTIDLSDIVLPTIEQVE